MKTWRKGLTTLVLVGGIATASSARADSITIGTANSGNCYPFTCSGDENDILSQYQQVYAADAFTSPLMITSIDFFQDFALMFGGDPSVVRGDFAISLSTTSSAVDGLSTILSDNVGADVRLFFSGVLDGRIVGGVLSISGMTPFLYNPSAGNLLIDVVVSNRDFVPNGSSNSYLDADDTGAATSRAWANNGEREGFASPDGLVTRFNAASVPEPGTLLLVGSGLLVAAWWGLSRR